MNRLLTKVLLSAILLSLTACETGIFIRKPHYHDHDHDRSQHAVSWGYTTGEPMLDAGYYGTFYPQAAHSESEGAVSY